MTAQAPFVPPEPLPPPSWVDRLRWGRLRAGFGVLRRPALRRAVSQVRRERRVLAAAATAAPPRPRVLAYHAVDLPIWNVNNVSTAQLVSQIRQARALGYRFGTLGEVLAAAPDEAVLAVTFDDGLRCTWDNARPVLAEHSVPWTLFVTTDFASGRSPRRPELYCDWTVLRHLRAEGVGIGSHSVTHIDFGPVGYEEALAELAPSRRVLEEQLGSEVLEFAIPFGNAANWNPEAHRAALDAGFEVVLAQSELLRPDGTVGRSFVSCFDDEVVFAALLGGAFDGWEEPTGD